MRHQTTLSKGYIRYVLVCLVVGLGRFWLVRGMEAIVLSVGAIVWGLRVGAVGIVILEINLCRLGGEEGVYFIRGTRADLVVALCFILLTRAG